MKNLFKALAGFQQEVPAVHKATEGYGYNYADLTTIFKVINPILKKHKLGFTQLLEGTNIKTVVFHTESGEMIEAVTEIPQGIALRNQNTFQVCGSSYTYFRRYALSSILGIVSDVDNDANGEEVKEVKKVKKPILDDKKFVKAIEAVKTGDYTISEIEDMYALSETQLNQLNKLTN